MAEKNKKQGRGTKPRRFRSPRSILGELTDDEVASIKQTVLAVYADKLNSKESATAAGITVRELSLLVQEDAEFAAAMQAIREADDDDLKDLARATLRRLVGCDNDSVAKGVAVYLDKSRGLYGENQKIEVKDDRPTADSILPVNIIPQATPKPKPKIANKPKEAPKPQADDDKAAHDIDWGAAN